MFTLHLRNLTSCWRIFSKLLWQISSFSDMIRPVLILNTTCLWRTFECNITDINKTYLLVVDALKLAFEFKIISFFFLAIRKASTVLHQWEAISQKYSRVFQGNVSYYSATNLNKTDHLKPLPIPNRACNRWKRTSGFFFYIMMFFTRICTTSWQEFYRKH